MVLMRAPLGRRGSYLPTGAQHRAVPRLVGVRADHHRDRRERALAAGARLRRRRVLEDPLRRRRDRPRVPRPGRLRAQVRAQVRGLGRDRLARSISPGGRCTASIRSPWHRRGAHAFWAGFDLVLASIISWTPLVADYTRFSRSRSAGFWGAGLGYFVPTIPLFALGAVIAMSRSDQRGACAADRDRGRRRGEHSRAARADGRRERRGVRERLLGRGQPAEPLAAASRNGCSSPASPRWRRSARCVVDLRNYQPFLYLLGSFFVPLFARAARRLAARGPPLRPRRRLPRAGDPAGDDRARGSPASPLPVAVAGRAGLVDATSSPTPIPTRCRGAARRCRASRRRSRSPFSPGRSPGARRLTSPVRRESIPRTPTPEVRICPCTTTPARDEADLARFGYKQELRRSLGVFSSFAVAFSYISPSTGIFTLFALGLGTIGGVFIWSWPLVAFGQFMIALGFAELGEPLPGRRVRLPVDEVPRREDVLVVRRLDLPVRRDPHRHRGVRDPAAGADPRLQQHGLGPREQPSQPADLRDRHAGRDHDHEHLRRQARRDRQQHRRAVRDPRHGGVRVRARAVPPSPERRA